MENCLSKRSEFYGKHLLLDFIGCRIDLDNICLIKEDMILAAESVGASIVGHSAYKFYPHGVTVILTLAKSHASAHTFPEHNSCFLDIFTCGRRIDIEPFGEVLAELWRPDEVYKHLTERFNPTDLRFNASMLKTG